MQKAQMKLPYLTSAVKSDIPYFPNLIKHKPMPSNGFNTRADPPDRPNLEERSLARLNEVVKCGNDENCIARLRRLCNERPQTLSDTKINL